MTVKSRLGKPSSNELSLVNAIDYAIKMTNGRKKQ